MLTKIDTMIHQFLTDKLKQIDIIVTSSCKVTHYNVDACLAANFT